MMAMGRLLALATASDAPRPRPRHEGHHDDDDADDAEDENDEAHQDAARHHAMSELFWYILIALVILGLILRLSRAWVARQRLARRKSHRNAEIHSWSPEQILSWLSMSRWIKRAPIWLQSAPLTQSIAIILYSAFIAALLTWKAVKHDEDYYERLGFRAAWISTTQPTLVFLLVARVNPIGFILGVSYERLNWLHRWASRLFFATVTIHGSFFLAEWVPANFFWEELRTVAMVKWGIAAWFVLLWTLISSLLPIRQWKYEVFVFQHVASAVMLLGLLFLHVPTHHQFSVWCATVAFGYDLFTRALNLSWRNIRLRMPASAALSPLPRYAYTARVEAVDHELTIINIKGVAFKWKAGQHVLIWTPSFRRQSPHPFTIVGAADGAQKTQDVQLLLKAKSGYTRDLNEWARRRDDRGQDANIRLLLAGPFGSPPPWRHYHRLVLVSASTGGSFTTAIFEDILTSADPGCLRHVACLFIVRRKEHVIPYLRRIARHTSASKELAISTHIEVAVTGGPSTSGASGASTISGKSRERFTEEDPFIVGEDGDELEDIHRESLESNRSSQFAASDDALKEDIPLTDDKLTGEDMIHESSGRPDIGRFIARELVSGEHSMVAVCGGNRIEGIVKQSVASMSSSLPTSTHEDVTLHIERSAT